VAELSALLPTIAWNLQQLKSSIDTRHWIYCIFSFHNFQNFFLKNSGIWDITPEILELQSLVTTHIGSKTLHLAVDYQGFHYGTISESMIRWSKKRMKQKTNANSSTLIISFSLFEFLLSGLWPSVMVFDHGIIDLGSSNRHFPSVWSVCTHQ